MGRKPTKSRAEDYGLSKLTIQEAARVLDVDEGLFMNWLFKTVRPSPSQWSMWEHGARTLPEALIRLYLTQHWRESDLKPPVKGAGKPARRTENFTV